MWYNDYWIDWIGGDFTKINITGYIKNINNNTKEIINTKGIKNKNKITYQIDEYKNKIIILKNKIIILRENNEINNILYFEKEKIIPSKYNIKDNNITFEINIKTKNIEINNNFIKIKYLVIDSNEEYEYYIEMSGY